MVLLGILYYASCNLEYVDLLCTFSGFQVYEHTCMFKDQECTSIFYCCYYFQLAMKPADLSKVLGTVFEQAQQLKKATEASTEFIRAPNVTVSYLLNGLMQLGLIHYYKKKKILSHAGFFG